MHFLLCIVGHAIWQEVLEINFVLIFLCLLHHFLFGLFGQSVHSLIEIITTHEKLEGHIARILRVGFVMALFYGFVIILRSFSKCTRLESLILRYVTAERRNAHT